MRGGTAVIVDFSDEKYQPQTGHDNRKRKLDERNFADGHTGDGFGENYPGINGPKKFDDMPEPVIAGGSEVRGVFFIGKETMIIQDL